MKTAISIPDTLFKEAELAARELSISRSELYAKAVEAFVRSRCQADVTEKLNQVYGKESAGLDPLLSQLQASSLPRESW